MSRPFKAPGERVVNAGVTLPPPFIELVRDCAKLEGFETLTSLVRYLLTQWLQAVDHKWGVKPLSIKSDQASDPRLDVAVPIRKVKVGQPRKRGRRRRPRRKVPENSFSKNDEEILRRSKFYAAYDEGTHMVIRDKPISDRARQRIDALFTNPPEYDAPDNY